MYAGDEEHGDDITSGVFDGWDCDDCTPFLCGCDTDEDVFA